MSMRVLCDAKCVVTFLTQQRIKLIPSVLSEIQFSLDENNKGNVTYNLCYFQFNIKTTTTKK